MWKQKQQSPAPQPVPPSSAPPPVSNTSKQASDGGDRSVQIQTHIGESLKLKGRITASEDIHVDGHLEGTIELPDHALLIGTGGHVLAEVTARSITTWGNLEGKMHVSERTQIRKGGSLTGELETEKIAIEDGGRFRGSVKLLQPEAEDKKPIPPPADKPPPAAASGDARSGASPDRSSGKRGKQEG